MNYDYGHALAGQGFHDVQYLAHHLRIQGRRGFVKEHFEVNNILLSDEAVLRRFLARRFEGDSNRFIMSFD